MQTALRSPSPTRTVDKPATSEQGQISIWQQWLHRPERVWLRKCFFYIHLWVGAAAGLYIVFMSFTGSLIVFRNELDRRPSLMPFVEWVVKLHANLLSGQNGRFVNGIGALSLIVITVTGAVIWWPGINNWRRALKFDWRSLFARFTWDLHSALGFWAFLFVLMWGVSGLYFSFPNAFSDVLYFFDPHDKFTNRTLLALSNLHFGRFNLFTEILWAALGLLPALLSFTGIFLCCRRMIYKVPPARP